MEPSKVYVLMYEDEIEGVFLLKKSAEEAQKFYTTRFGAADNYHIVESDLIG